MKLRNKILAGSLIYLGLMAVGQDVAHADQIILDRDKTEGVNIRSEKSNDAPILDGIEDYTRYDIKAEDGDWYQIEYDGEPAFVGKDWFYRISDANLIKDADLKAEANKDSENNIDYTLKKSTKVNVLAFDEETNYVKVSYNVDDAINKGINLKDKKELEDKDKGEKIGYLPLESLSISKKKKEDLDSLKETYKKLNESIDKYNEIDARSKEEEETYEVIYVTYFTDEDGEVIDNDSSELGKSIYNYALDYVGSPYVFGGVSKTNGIDCSGLVLRTFENFGLSLPHSAKMQAEYGKTIPFGMEQAGDLVFFGSSYADIYHVAIADGMGNMVHAASPGQGVIVSPIYDPFVIKRIFE